MAVRGLVARLPHSPNPTARSEKWAGMRRESGTHPNVLLMAAGLSHSFVEAKVNTMWGRWLICPFLACLLFMFQVCVHFRWFIFSFLPSYYSHCMYIVNHSLPWNNFPLCLSAEGRAKERRVAEQRVTPRSDVFRTLTQTGLRERHTVVSVSSYLPLEIVLAPTMARI